MPMFIQGLAGVSRRLATGGYDYAHANQVIHLNEFMSISAFMLAFFQIFFVANFIWTIMRHRGDDDMDTNPWKSTTIEWTETTSPPLGHGNFETVPQVYRSAYEYSVEGRESDYYPQTEE